MNGREVPVSVQVLLAAMVATVAIGVGPALPPAASDSAAADGDVAPSVDGFVDVVERIDAILESVLDLVRTIRALLGAGG